MVNVQDYGLGVAMGIQGIGAMTDAPGDGSFGPNGPPPSYGVNMAAASAAAACVNARDVVAYRNARGQLDLVNAQLIRMRMNPVPIPKPSNEAVWRSYTGVAGDAASTAAELQAEGMTRRDVDAWLASDPDGKHRDKFPEKWLVFVPGGAKYVKGYPNIDKFQPYMKPAMTMITPSGQTVVHGVPYNPNSKIPLPDPKDPVAVAAYTAARKIEELFLAQGATPTEARVAAGDAAGEAAASADLQQKMMIGGGGLFALAAFWIVMNRRRG